MNMYKKMMMVAGLFLVPVVCEVNAVGNDLRAKLYEPNSLLFTIGQGLRFDSILNTLDRIDFANGLVAKSSAEFKKYMHKAKKRQQHNVLLCKISLGVAPIGLSAIAIFNSIKVHNAREMILRQRGLYYDQIRDQLAAQTGINSLGGVLGSLTGSLTAGVLHLKRAQKRVEMYSRFAAHAELLYSLLHNEMFKKNVGVLDWDEVRKCRKNAELVGLFSSMGGAAISELLENKVSVFAFIPKVFSQWALKPIIAKAMRKKGGAPKLEEEFEKAIKRHKKGQLYMPAMTQQQQVQQTYGFSQPTYAPQPVVYESARDKYLRMLAEKQQAKIAELAAVAPVSDEPVTSQPSAEENSAE